MKQIMTVGEYAKKLGTKRLNVHNWIKTNKLDKLPGILKIQQTVDGVNILTVDEDKLNAAKKAPTN